MAYFPLMVVVAVFTMCQGSLFFGLPNYGHRPVHPRCPSIAKPCRLRSDLKVTSSEGVNTSESIDTGEICSCPYPRTCSDDWVADQNKVIVRELVSTNIHMTVSMMFCDVVQPQQQCTSNDVALQLKGHGIIPQEVTLFNCACSDARPLILNEQSISNSDHMTYSSYVCASFKRRCIVRRNNREVCWESTPDVDRYLCRCPVGFDCTAVSSSSYEYTNYTCARG